MSFAPINLPPRPEPPQARAPELDTAAPPRDFDEEHEDDAGEIEVTITFFTDHTATTTREQRLSLTALAELIHTTTAATKDKLPWLKFARFGDHRSKGGSLRNNENVVAIAGLEADYDAKQMSLADAKDILARSGIASLIYPSPSYTPNEPKWRVLAPFSREYPPEARDRFMARLSGLFAGVFSNESWTLSQSYYFGRVGNPDHHVTVFDGVPIDLADTLDATAISRPKDRGVGRLPQPKSKPEDISEARVQGVVRSLLDNIRRAPDGSKHVTLRDNCLTLGGYIYLAGWSAEEAAEQAVAALPASVDDWDQARETAEWAIGRGMERPLELEERPHQQARPKPNGADHSQPPYEPPLPDTDERTENAPSSSDVWPEPVDILADQDPGAAPILAERHVPVALWPFIADTAERMGVATSTVALCSTVACAAAISEEWKLQPKRHDWTWTERACLWGAPIGPPGIMKTPVIALATAPFDALEVAAREQWNEDMAAHRLALAEWKAAGEKDPEPHAPRMARYLVQSTTVEALQEVLRDDAAGKFYAPLGKVLSKQDELAEFLAGMDRYSAGKSGGGDRGAYLRLYDGGRFTIDRIGRGSFTANSWSGCILGGIQPEPIQQIARNATDDGLLQRFMFDVPSPRGPGQDRGPNHTAIETYRSLFPALAAMRPVRIAEGGPIAHVVLHADAHASRESIDATARAMSLWPDASPQLQSAFSKWSGLFARLCLTFHLIELAAARATGSLGPPPNVVSPETAARVRAYMREILAPMLLRAETIMFASRQTTHAAWIAAYIIAGGLDRVAARDIVQNYRQLRAPEHRDTLESTMDNLCIVGWLRPETPRGGATRPTAWRVNPAVHSRFAERAAAERARRDAIQADIATHVAEIRRTR